MDEKRVDREKGLARGFQTRQGLLTYVCASRGLAEGDILPRPFSGEDACKKAREKAGAANCSKGRSTSHCRSSISEKDISSKEDAGISSDDGLQEAEIRV